ncbi:hypothetical protein [Vannielia litorea]|uniref:hypothetical protein n=1 Tax=Vannielia litorea TaxID=1217970 RepID=UPI001BCF988E|nr:hypothetical protein [Vannielia litorea]MBS8227103.1 hypothetical protein [Vannielia litorea]
MSQVTAPSQDAPSRDADIRPLYYVLSAGRTGTVFLENLINRHFPEVFIAHEPAPTRSLMMLGNLRNDFGLMGGAARWLSRRHQRAFHGPSGKRIEVNPFLCAVTDLLPHPTRPLRIVHVVREPGGWAQSMTTFKASSRYRHVIDYVPFAKPFPAPRPAGWRGLSPFEKSLHRWVWCNRRIAALAEKAEAYALVRSEDIFSGEAERRDAAMNRVFDVLQLEPPASVDPKEFGQRVNPAPPGVDLRDAAAERAICGAAAADFGYDLKA